MTRFLGTSLIALDACVFQALLGFGHQPENNFA